MTDKTIVEKYRNIDNKVFMSIYEAEVLSMELARRIKEKNLKIDKIIGIANGAILPVTIISNFLGLPMEMIKIRRKGSGIKRKLSKVPFILNFVAFFYKLPFSKYLLISIMDRFNQLEDSNSDGLVTDGIEGSTILIVDDVIDSGQTLKRIYDMQFELNSNVKLYSAVISWYSSCQNKIEGAFEPDFFTSKKIHHYPWSQNSMYFSEYQQWLANRDLNEWK